MQGMRTSFKEPIFLGLLEPHAQNFFTVTYVSAMT